MPFPPEVRAVVIARLAAAGCVAPDEEADELLLASLGDAGVLEGLVVRRCQGFPLAWVTGSTTFCGVSVGVAPGVYVPRWQSEPIAHRAAALLPPTGRAIDLGTGCGAIAVVLATARPDAEILGVEIDPEVASTARRNGVSVAVGDLYEALPPTWAGTIDVVVGVLPYVPTSAIAWLPRDVRDHEPLLALDGGEDGTAVVRRAVAGATRWLRAGGSLLLEVGGDEAELLAPHFEAAGLDTVCVIRDADGDVRGIEAVAISRHIGPTGRYGGMLR